MYDRRNGACNIYSKIMGMLQNLKALLLRAVPFAVQDCSGKNCNFYDKNIYGHKDPGTCMM